MQRQMAVERQATEQELRDKSVRVSRERDIRMTQVDQTHADKASALKKELGALEARMKVSPSESLQQQIDALRRRQEVLEDEYNERRAMDARQRYIDGDERLSRFYRSVLVKLQEFFLACKALDSGKITREANTTRDRVAQGIELLGDWVPFPGATTIATVLSKAVSLSSDKREEKRAANVADMVGTFREIDSVTEEVACELTRRYEEQIQSLRKDGARDLGECAVKYMMVYISFVDTSHSTVQKMLLEAVTSVRLRTNTFDAKLITLPTFSHKAIAAEGKRDWTDEGIFLRTGIRTSDGRYFGGKKVGDARPEKYGYRLGTAHEAASLGLKETEGRVETDVAELTANALSKAARQTVKDFVADGVQAKGEMELVRRQMGAVMVRLEACEAAPSPSPKTLTLRELQATLADRLEIAKDAPELEAEFAKIRAKYGALANTSHLRTKGVPAEVDDGVAALIHDYLRRQ
eukprot:Opistho-2@42162